MDETGPNWKMTQAATITVYKLDDKGREVWRYPARILARHEASVRLEAFFNRPDVVVGPVVFAEGDRFVETFYSDRWYNVFAVYDGETGDLKGWYCNICRPAEIGEGEVRCEDLALDIWVDAGGVTSVLDEEEFSSLELSDSERQKAKEAAQDVCRLGTEGMLPL